MSSLFISNFQFALLILQIVVAVLLILLVLIQKTDGDSLSGIGANNNPTSRVLSGKSSANLLTKTTTVLVVIFMLNCLILASISKSAKNSLIEDIRSTESEVNKQPKSSVIPSVE